MRQAVRAFIISGVLLSAAACGTATNPAPGEQAVGIGTATAPPSGTQTEATIRSSCEAIGQVYSTHMAPIAEALSKLAADRSSPGDDKASERQVQQSLTAFATAIRGATDKSADPQLQAAGKKAADQLKAKAADRKLFSEVKTPQDVNTAVGPTLKEWLSPIEQQCS